jgi:protein SCO1/2
MNKMKNNQIALLVVVVSMLSCSNGAKTEQVKSETNQKKECCSKETGAGAMETISDESLFNISSQWQTQKKQTFAFNGLKGKTTITAMIFTSCQSACPRIMADLKNIESGLNAEEMKQVQFLLVTMDPERDTPGRLSTFKREHQLNDNWTLVCSDEDATTEIANVLGVRIKKLSGGGFDHSNTIFVLNTNGVITYKKDGLGGAQTETIAAIKSLQQ